MAKEMNQYKNEPMEIEEEEGPVVQRDSPHPALFAASRVAIVFGMIIIFACGLLWYVSNGGMSVLLVIPPFTGGLFLILAGLIGSILINIESNQREILKELIDNKKG